MHSPNYYKGIINKTSDQIDKNKENIKILKQYKPQFSTEHDNYYLIHKDLDTTITKPSFWQGELYKEFHRLAEGHLRENSKKYYKSMGIIINDIETRIDELKSTNSQLKDTLRSNSKLYFQALANENSK